MAKDMRSNQHLRGSALVESALVLPLYFMIFFAQLTIAIMGMQQICLIGASFDYLHTMIFANESDPTNDAKNMVKSWPFIPHELISYQTTKSTAVIPSDSHPADFPPQLGAVRVPIIESATLSLPINYGIPFFGGITGTLSNTARDNYVVYNDAQYALPLMSTQAGTEQMIYGGYTTTFYPSISGASNMFSCDYEFPPNGGIAGGPPQNDQAPTGKEPKFSTGAYYSNAAWDTCPPFTITKPPTGYVTTPDPTDTNNEVTYSFKPLNLSFKLATEELEQKNPGVSTPVNLSFITADECNTNPIRTYCEAPKPDETPQATPLYSNTGTTFGNAAIMQEFYESIALFLGGIADDKPIRSELKLVSSTDANVASTARDKLLGRYENGTNIYSFHSFDSYLTGTYGEMIKIDPFTQIEDKDSNFSLAPGPARIPY